MTDARLKPRRPERARHPWIFAGEIAALPDAAENGGIVRVLDQRGRFFATAYLNRASKITLRVVSWLDEPVDESFWRRRVGEAAIDLRGPLAPDAGRRIVNSEGDGLPGLIVDSYAGWLVVQLSTLGIERAREPIVAALVEYLSPQGIYERSDVPERSLEGLEPRTGVLTGASPPELVEIGEGPARAAGRCRPRTEDRLVPGPTAQSPGGGAVRGRAARAQLFRVFGWIRRACVARRRAEVINVDISAEACRLAERNFALNRCLNTSVVEANCFDWLRKAADAEEKFGMIVLDPPAFARGRSALEGAIRGYKEINLRALKLLEPGGILVTCSCSRPVTRELFAKMLRDAATDARRDVQILEERGQPPDHPVLIAAPETAYLKCVIARNP